MFRPKCGIPLHHQRREKKNLKLRFSNPLLKMNSNLQPHPLVNKVSTVHHPLKILFVLKKSRFENKKHKAQHAHWHATCFILKYRWIVITIRINLFTEGDTSQAVLALQAPLIDLRVMFPQGLWPQLHFLNGGSRDYAVICNHSITAQLVCCMTLDVENCHSTVHIKQANMSMKEYARSFELTMKESIKRVTQWAAFYHTSRK